MAFQWFFTGITPWYHDQPAWFTTVAEPPWLSDHAFRGALERGEVERAARVMG